jgi:hypothetical protein
MLCEDCHRLQHFGINRINGHAEEMVAHLAEVRGCTVEEAQSLCDQRETMFLQLSAFEWDLDLTGLAEFGIQVGPEVLGMERRRRKAENQVRKSVSYFNYLSQG